MRLLLQGRQVVVVETTFKNGNLADPKVLVLEQDPDLHLPLVEIVAYFVKVVVQDVLQVMRLDSYDFCQDLFTRFLLFLVIADHKFHLSLKYFAEEVATCLAHFQHLKTHTLPSDNKLMPLPHLILQCKLATVGYEEFFKQLRSFLLLQVFRHHVVER